MPRPSEPPVPPRTHPSIPDDVIGNSPDFPFASLFHHTLLKDITVSSSGFLTVTQGDSMVHTSSPYLLAHIWMFAGLFFQFNGVRSYRNFSVPSGTIVNCVFPLNNTLVFSYLHTTRIARFAITN